MDNNNKIRISGSVDLTFEFLQAANSPELINCGIKKISEEINQELLDGKLTSFEELYNLLKIHKKNATNQGKLIIKDMHDILSVCENNMNSKKLHIISDEHTLRGFIAGLDISSKSMRTLHHWVISYFHNQGSKDS